MTDEIFTTILVYYDKEISGMIAEKYGYDDMDALRLFLGSQTYQMLIDKELEMWDFSPIGLFDMWESEKVTGNPRNSLYIRRD